METQWIKQKLKGPGSLTQQRETASFLKIEGEHLPVFIKVNRHDLENSM